MNPATQSLMRPLSEGEVDLAKTLEGIFASGRHELSDVVVALNEAGVGLPSGGRGGWTLAVLESELRAINQDLDAAYDAGASKENDRT